MPRCALEASDSGQVRIDKILKIISESQFGIHDISRTDLDPDHNLPRFNMPLELGLFLGSKRFGNKNQKSKSCIIFDSEKFRYQKFISDIAGQDIYSHDNDPDTLIRNLRDWFDNHTSQDNLAGGEHIVEMYKNFLSSAPAICSSMRLQEKNITFKNLVFLMKGWVDGKITHGWTVSKS